MVRTHRGNSLGAPERNSSEKIGVLVERGQYGRNWKTQVIKEHGGEGKRKRMGTL